MVREIPGKLPLGNNDNHLQGSSKVQDELVHWQSITQEQWALRSSSTWNNLSERQMGILSDAGIKGREFFALLQELPAEQKQRLLQFMPEFKIKSTDNFDSAMTKGIMANLIKPGADSVEEVRRELQKQPQVLQKFNEWVSERNKLEGQSEPERQALQTQRERIQRIQAIADEQAKLATFSDIANTRGKPGETKTLYNTHGDEVVIKYDQQCYTNSFSYVLSKEHARNIWEQSFRSPGQSAKEFTDDVYKQIAAQQNGTYQYSNEKGFQYKGGNLGYKFFSEDKTEPGLIRLLADKTSNKPAEPEQKPVTPPRPVPDTNKTPSQTDKKNPGQDISREDRLPVVAKDSSFQTAAPSINNVLSGFDERQYECPLGVALEILSNVVF